ncbi:hypothetical protein POKO110462_01280 [Pontibacter korlensis]
MMAFFKYSEMVILLKPMWQKGEKLCFNIYMFIRTMHLCSSHHTSNENKLPHPLAAAFLVRCCGAIVILPLA